MQPPVQAARAAQERQEHQDAYIVTIASEPTHQTTIGDVIYGSLGIVGILLVIALVLGGVLSGVLVLWHKRHRPEDDHLPPVVPEN